MPAHCGPRMGLRHSSSDPAKPNMIFSSNIPSSLAQCVCDNHLFQGGSHSRVVDLAGWIPPLEIMLELNSLLLRNPSLSACLSLWVRSNLVFVAKSSVPEPKKTPKASFWDEVLSLTQGSDVFVVTITLQLALLLVDLFDVSDIKVSFVKNESYDAILLRDPELLLQIETYIKKRLRAELIANSSSISNDISSSSTILQELPVNESMALMRKLRQQLENDVWSEENDDEISNLISNISMESAFSPPPKQKHFMDSPDILPSDDEMRLLSSDDSGKNTANDEDDDTDEKHFSYSLHGSENLAFTPHDILPVDEGNCSFDSPLTDAIPFLPSKDMQPPSSSSKVATPKKPAKIESPIPLPHTPNNKFRKSYEYEDRPMSAPEQPTPSAGLGSPMRPSVSQRASLPTLRKKDSFSYYSMVSSDDGNSDLEYAFRDKSPTVPSYIKEDRKFKFIKVGKVQKFVHLFEEKKDLDSGSRPSSRSSSRAPSRAVSRSTSRQPTRPGSPIRRKPSLHFN